MITRTSPRALAPLTLAASIFSLAFAYTMQYGFGFEPCILCLYQRPAYFMVAAFTLLAIFLSTKNPRAARAILWICVLLFVIETAIAFFQVGVEYQWWRGFAGCSGPDPTTMSAVEYLAALQTAPTVRCDVVQFSVMGISMAGMNAVWAAALAAGLSIGLIRSRG
jgi:disulfide bond formation protein DsbB